jgi:hypothetical protein
MLSKGRRMLMIFRRKLFLSLLRMGIVYLALGVDLKPIY